jgi:molybdate transport system substrate-binding protein
MKQGVCAVWAALVLLGAPAMAAEIKVLSAGAVEPGLIKLADEFKREHGADLKIQVGTAPQLTRRLAGGEVADVLIAPPGVLEEQVKNGKVTPDGRIVVGRVGAGVIVRSGAAAPNIASVDALKQALLSADSVVYNTASTGIYLEKLFEKIGIAEQIKAKTTRYPNGEAVMEHVINGKGNEIGFGAITEIRTFEPKGLKLVGPLPAEVQNYTTYSAGIMTAAPSPAAARDFVRYLSTAGAKATFAATGVE